VSALAEAEGVSLLALVVLAVAARWWWALRTARVRSGRPPDVMTDDLVRLHTETDGRADAPVTVVFVHGFAARLEAYARQRAALRDRARLVLFDQRGHGRSGWRGPRSATVERLGRDLGCVLDVAAPDRPVVLVGHSMGGMAILALARQRPELFADRVAGVALLSTSADRVTHIGWAHPVLWLVWALAPLIDPPAAVAARIETMWTTAPQSLAAAFYPALASYDAGTALPVLREVPTLVLTGTADATIADSHSERLAGALGPAARLVRVPAAGHMVVLTHPAEVNAELSRLLDRASGPA
jgi:pimeloyl-ACP methyl ester carboxylesterase